MTPDPAPGSQLPAFGPGSGYVRSPTPIVGGCEAARVLEVAGNHAEANRAATTIAHVALNPISRPS
jgi:hypothetical protein